MQELNVGNRKENIVGKEKLGKKTDSGRKV